MDKPNSKSTRAASCFGDVRPRTLLVAGTSLSLFITATCIVTMMAVLYSDFSRQREILHLQTVSQIVKDFGNQFETSFLNEHRYEMADQMFLIVNLMERVYDTKWDNDLLTMKQNMAAFQSVVEHAFQQRRQSVLERNLERMQATMDTYNILTTPASAAPPASFLTNALTNKLQGSMMAVTQGGIVVRVPSDTASGGTISHSAYLSTECAQRALASSSSSGILINTTDLAGVTSDAAYLNFNGVAVCVFLRFDDVLRDGISVVQEYVTGANKARDAMKVTKKNSPYVNPYRKFLLSNDNIVTATSNPDSITALVCSPTSPLLNVADTMSMASRDEQSRLDIIDAFEHLNWEFGRTTELIVGRVDPETNRFDCQVTRFRFNKTCHSDCYRSTASCNNAYASFQTRGSASSITPDYRPEPVIGAYTWMKSMGMAMGLERDVLEVRHLAMQQFVSLLDHFNALMLPQTTLQVHVMHYFGIPTMQTIPNRTDAAGPRMTSTQGVLWDPLCPDCMKKPTIDIDSVEYLTKIQDCSGENEKCVRRSRQTALDMNIAALSEEAGFAFVTDYRKEIVHAGYSFIQKLNVGILVKVDERELRNPTTNMGITCALSGFAIAIGGLILVLLICSGMLRRIEKEYEEVVDFHEKMSGINQKAKILQSRFFVYMCHDAQSPLNVLMSILEGIMVMEDLPSVPRERLTIAMREGRYLMTQINEMILLGKVEFNAKSMENVPFRMLEAIEHVEMAVMTFAEHDNYKTSIAFEFDERALPDIVCGDRGKITQVWRTLITFAMRSMKALSIYVHIFQDSGLVLQPPHKSMKSVAITFEIMMEADCPQIDVLKALFETDRVLELGGDEADDRMGIIVAQHVAQQMHGDVQIDFARTQPGLTMCMVAKMVVDIPNNQEVLLDENVEESSALEPGLHVLYIEKVALNIMVVQHFCQQLQVNLTVRPEIDLDLLPSFANEFDVLLLNCDIGVEYICREALKLKIKNPIIGLTSSSDKEKLAYWEALGVSSILRAPISKGELRNAFARWDGRK